MSKLRQTVLRVNENRRRFSRGSPRLPAKTTNRHKRNMKPSQKVPSPRPPLNISSLPLAKTAILAASFEPPSTPPLNTRRRSLRLINNNAPGIKFIISPASEDAKAQSKKTKRRLSKVDPTLRGTKSYTYPWKAVKYFHARHFREEALEEEEEVWLADGLWLQIECREDSISKAQCLLEEEDYSSCVTTIRRSLAEFKDEGARRNSRSLRVPIAEPRAWMQEAKSLRKVLERINLWLIRCCCFLTVGRVKKALHDAVEAFKIANSTQSFYMICKCRLYIGICLSKLHRWEEAVTAFELAAEIPVSGWEERMEHLERMASSSLLRQNMGLRELDKAACLELVWSPLLSP